ncbi:MAG: hypothetical protein J0H42_04355 [Rhizobiales bacterium]|nr:hypothetical protein [Hyphomicrobiales bacterium]
MAAIRCLPFFLIFLLAVPSLSACTSTVTRDVDYLGTAYADAEPYSPVQVDSADGPIQMRVRLNKANDKALVMLDTGALKRALAKDFGSENNALPETSFREAASRRIIEVRGAECEPTTGTRRQDYLWEFDVACGTAAERKEKQRVAAKCRGDIACEYREAKKTAQKQRCDAHGGVTIGMTAAQIRKSCWGILRRSTQPSQPVASANNGYMAADTCIWKTEFLPQFKHRTEFLTPVWC